MNPYVGSAGLFLIETLFGLYILAVMLRFLLQLVRANFYNPVSQALVTVTNPTLRPLRRIIPGFAGVDLAAVVLMVALQLVELYLVGVIKGASLAPAGMALMAVADLLSLLLWIFFFSILIEVILSWVSPGGYNPVAAVVYRLNEPLLGHARQLLPPLGGLDLSPILVIIVLEVIRRLLLWPLKDFAGTLT